METNKIINLWHDVADRFGVNERYGITIFVNGEKFDVGHEITSVDIRIFMYLVASKQIPANSVYFEQYINGNVVRNYIKNDGTGKCKDDFVGRFFSADDHIAFAQFDEGEF